MVNNEECLCLECFLGLPGTTDFSFPSAYFTLHAVEARCLVGDLTEPMAKCIVTKGFDVGHVIIEVDDGGAD